MCRGVCTKQGRPINVIVVVFASCYMILSDQQNIEVLFRGNNRTDVVKVSINQISCIIAVYNVMFYGSGER